MQGTITKPELAAGTFIVLPEVYDYVSEAFNDGKLTFDFIGPNEEKFSLPCTYHFRGFYDHRHTYDFEVVSTIFAGFRLRFMVHDWKAAGIQPIESY